MTPANLAATGTASGRAHPATVGRVVLWTFVAVNLAVVWTLFYLAPPSKNAIIGVAKFVGLHLALLIVLQIILIARIPWLDRRVGMDRLTAWHRWVGFAVFWAVVLHPTLILLGYSRLYKVSFIDQFVDFTGVPATLYGMLAVSVIIVAVGLSIKFARARLSYEAWHAVHVCLYVAITLALIHQLYESSTMRTSTAAKVYWWALWGFAIGALLVGRLVMPLLVNARHRLRVAAVVPESDNVTSVYVEGRDLDQLDGRAGQFVIWRFLAKGLWWQANPFSLSAAPDGRYLRLTAKAVGGTSRALRHVPVGTRVYIEGPYGAFTGMHRSREATLLIAGGVGVTPVRALLQELTGPVTVLYRARSREDAVLLRELEELAQARGARLHLLTGRTGPGNDPLSPQGLSALVPDVADRDVFVCGPPAMTEAVLRSLRALKVPKRQVHAERFSLAGKPAAAPARS